MGSAFGGEGECIQAFVKGQNHFENVGVEGRIILKWNSRLYDGRTGLIWSRIGIIC
jgi:hypothetical protein